MVLSYSQPGIAIDTNLIFRLKFIRETAKLRYLEGFFLPTDLEWAYTHSNIHTVSGVHVHALCFNNEDEIVVSTAVSNQFSLFPFCLLDSNLRL